MTSITNGNPGDTINKPVITETFQVELDGNPGLETVKVSYQHSTGCLGSVTVNQVKADGTETKLTSELFGGSYNPVPQGEPVATFQGTNNTTYGVYIENGGLKLDVKKL